MFATVTEGPVNFSIGRTKHRNLTLTLSFYFVFLRQGLLNF